MSKTTTEQADVFDSSAGKCALLQARHGRSARVMVCADGSWVKGDENHGADLARLLREPSLRTRTVMVTTRSDVDDRYSCTVLGE